MLRSADWMDISTVSMKISGESVPLRGFLLSKVEFRRSIQTTG